MSHKRTLLSTQDNAVFSQGENAALTYTVNWVGRLDADTIATSTWTNETTGITIENEASTDTTTSARLSATPGRYLLTNKITLTTLGDTMEQQFIVEVKNNDRSFINDFVQCRSYH